MASCENFIDERAIYLTLWTTVIQTVTVVMFGVDNISSNGTGCFRIKSKTDTA